MKTISMSRRLTLASAFAMTFVAVLVVGGFYLFTTAELEKTFDGKVEQTLSYLDGTLAPVLWNFDHNTALLVAQTALRDDLVVGVTIRDGQGKKILSIHEQEGEGELVKTRTIHFQDVIVGELILHFSRFPLTHSRVNVLWVGLTVWFLAVLSIMVLNKVFIRRYFRWPLASFIDLAQSYRNHPESLPLNTTHFVEFQPIEEVVRDLANDVYRQLKELSESEAKFRRIFESVEDGYVLADMDGTILSVNPATARMLNYDNPAQLEGKNISRDVYTNTQQRDELEADLREQSKLKCYLMDFQQRDGGVISAEFNVQLVFDEAGIPTAIEGTFRDVTERNRAEEELRVYKEHLEDLVTERTNELKTVKEKAEAANQAKSTFLTNMSHELRTPLNAVLGFTELMARDPETNLQQKDNLSIITRSGQHLLGLINDVLDMSKIEAGRTELEPETVELHRLLHDIDDMFRLRTETKDLQFSLDLAPRLPQYVELDMGKLRQVLINLLGNAIKFTDSGGVTLRADAEALSNDKWQLRFEVEDTGIGIPADKLETIFEAFAQADRSPAKQQGTGLGLAISRQFIQLMGGEITVQSTPNKGSKFRFEIPAEAADVSELEQSIDESQRVVSLAADEPEWRILIVEDVHDNSLLLRRVLESVGFCVREAANGIEAIQKFQDWHPQLIWMDMRMPVMDGYEATRRIRTLPEGKDVKILALTASTFKEQDEQIINVGCDAVLHKPYNESTIFTAMEKQLGLHYIYEETNELLSQASFSELGVEDLQGLSEEWLVQFLTLARLGDSKAMLIHTDTLAAEHAGTKAKLNYYINEFQFQNLIVILEEKIGSAKDV